MKKIEVKCDKCNFVTHFVIEGDVIKRDIDKHGQDAQVQRCFNCNMPVKIVTEPEIKTSEPEIKSFGKKRKIKKNNKLNKE